MEEEELVRELAQIALSEVAPEELAVFDETADEFFADPDGVLNPQNRDEAVGFGLDAALATPFVLAVVMPVVHYLVNTVAAAAKDEAATTVKSLVKRLFRKLGNDESTGDPPRRTRGRIQRLRRKGRASILLA